MNAINTQTVHELTDTKRDQIEELTRVSMLMQFQARMPVYSFMPKDEAYKQVGCDPRAAMFIFAR